MSPQEIPTLGKDEYVLFENGKKEGVAEVRYSFREQAFYTELTDKNGEIIRDEDGHPIRIYSNNIQKKKKAKNGKFTPSAEKCTVQIFPEFETKKSYAIFAGTNGLVKNVKVYYSYIAKSICWIDEEGKIFAPAWAIK